MDDDVERHAGPSPIGLTAGERTAVPRSRLAGWSCALPRLPAETSGQRAADRVLRVMEVGGRFGVVAAVTVGQLVAPLTTSPAWLVVSDAVALFAGAYCALNFWRCREAHCVVTGAGWLVLGAFSLIEAGLGGSMIGGWEQTVFVAILVVGYLFEAGWRWRTGSNAVRGAVPGSCREGLGPGA